jgi:predicted enzyme related to lactoylglutathione lyase
MSDGFIFFEIQADDLARGIEFYRSIFGWEFTQQPHAPLEYWDIATGNARGGILKRPAPPPPPGHGTNAFVCSVEVDNFDLTTARILSNGGQVVLEKFAVPGRCWQGYFLDTEGNTFGIFQVDDQAGLA